MRASLPVAAAGLLLFATPLSAQGSAVAGAAVPEYGNVFPTTGAQQRPDPRLRYRVVFSITKAASDPAKVNPSLEKVARYLNILAADGVHARNGDIVAVVHGAAVPAILGANAYATKFGGARNPNLDLIDRLRKAGVVVSVCDQALQGQGFEPGQVAGNVRVDVSAMTTLTTLQLKGWALLED